MTVRKVQSVPLLLNKPPSNFVVKV